MGGRGGPGMAHGQEVPCRHPLPPRRFGGFYRRPYPAAGVLCMTMLMIPAVLVVAILVLLLL